MKSLPSINPEQEVDKIIRFLKKTFKEQKIDKVVLGLSGGIDSTVVLYLLKKALPLVNIYAVQMDYKPRKKLKIDLKGINIISVSIKNIIDKFENNIVKGEGIEFFFDSGLRDCEEEPAEIKKIDTEPLKKIRLGNIMARVRMIILFDLAKQLGALVCGTENKSEKLLGYFTRFGDSASDIEPISYLYKTQVYQLSRYLKVPDQIINQPPTAGLWNGQKDEDDFGFTYEEADQVLYFFERFYSHSRGSGNPELLDPRFHGDDTKHIKILIKKLMKNFPNAEKIIKRVQDNRFKQKTPYSLK